jgi:excinuclease UvrABC nuclease subunit
MCQVHGEGDEELLRFDKPLYSTPTHRRRLLAEVRAGCENRPGVYRMLDRSGAVAYVGKSRALRTRLLSYFRAAGRGNRQARILRHAFAVEWEYTSDEFAALLLELRLIKRHRPPQNVTAVEDEWPRAYVALTRGPVPALHLVRRTDVPEADALYGPFRLVERLGEAIRALAELTGVRDCSPQALGSQPARRAPGCLRVELGSCAGPCVGGGSADRYLEGVEQARAFLELRSRAPLESARRRMREAAASLAFERAASLRDKAERLRWLRGRLLEFRASMDRLSFRYVVRGVDGISRVYLIRRGTVRAELPAPGTAEASAALEALARRLYLQPDPTGGDVPAHDLEQFYVVASWFRRRPSELANTTPGVASVALA